MTHSARIAGLLAIVTPLMLGLAWAPQPRSSGTRIAAGPFRTLIVGGGPDVEHNQVAIESNVRYVKRLLPTGSSLRILFTDGNLDSKNVLCEDADKKTYYRTPELSRIDGPSDLSHVQAELGAMSADLAASPGSPALVYFTGHGSPNAQSKYENNHYDLWNRHELTVRQLATQLKSFPKSSPIALVMVECFSGAFGNVIFDGGDPAAPLSDLHICGFFASAPWREAAGCTPEINEANYRDFTGFFFAALTGIDRLGKPVTGADYNHDGKVGMDEALAYALIHDDSIDTPVCTSDVFLRRFVPSKDEEALATPFSSIQAWARPAQLAALNYLAKSLELTGEDRTAKAYQLFSNIAQSDPDTTELRDVHIIRFVRLAKSIVLAHMLQSSHDDAIKARFASLLAAESQNPLR